MGTCSVSHQRPRLMMASLFVWGFHHHFLMMLSRSSTTVWVGRCKMEEKAKHCTSCTSPCPTTCRFKSTVGMSLTKAVISMGTRWTMTGCRFGRVWVQRELPQANSLGSTQRQPLSRGTGPISTIAKHQSWMGQRNCARKRSTSSSHQWPAWLMCALVGRGLHEKGEHGFDVARLAIYVLHIRATPNCTCNSH